MYGCWLCCIYGCMDMDNYDGRVCCLYILSHTGADAYGYGGYGYGYGAGYSYLDVYGDLGKFPPCELIANILYVLIH